MNHRQPAIHVALANRQQRLEVDRTLVSQAVRNVLAEAGIRGGRISVAVVDDAEMQRLNRQFLEHDYPTDVLSFLLEASPRRFEAEIVVSADTAVTQAQEYGWTVDDELLLYVVHGALHLAGHDDHRPRERAAMRAQERKHLARLGRGPAVQKAAASKSALRRGSKPAAAKSSIRLGSASRRALSDPAPGLRKTGR